MKGKRPVSGTTGSAPATPSSERSSLPAPTTPQEPAPEAPPAKKRRVPKSEEPVTALAKGREMAAKLLKKKSDSANLALTLQSVAYAEQLCSEMNSFSKRFEFWVCVCKTW